MKLSYLTFLVLAVCFGGSAFAQDRAAFLCGGKHEIHSEVVSEFYLMADFTTVRNDDHGQEIITVYLKSTSGSRVPQNGLDRVVDLRVVKLETVGSQRLFTLRANDLIFDGSKVSFEMTAWLPEDGRSYRLHDFNVDKWSIDGKCMRRADLDSVWPQHL